MQWLDTSSCSCWWLTAPGRRTRSDRPLAQPCELTTSVNRNLPCPKRVTPDRRVQPWGGIIARRSRARIALRRAASRSNDLADDSSGAAAQPVTEGPEFEVRPPGSEGPVSLLGRRTGVPAPADEVYGTDFAFPLVCPPESR
ncbi:MAG: hypothetical protein AW07_00780 [Candidatus Accumulibacter sp. SK-11]|nr:MAG: hypothetical protein AW07_00780 [Candidatus Accumulibacter sp. SK-11]